MRRKWLGLLAIPLLLGLVACGGGGGGGSGNEIIGGGGGGGDGGGGEILTGAPTAKAGSDQAVIAGDIVLLDASTSSDPENGTLSFSWVQLMGPDVVLNDADSVSASFLAPEIEDPQTFVFKLIVTDEEFLSDEDVITVHVDPEPSVLPKAVIAPVSTVTPGSEIVLDGSFSSDPYGGDLIYSWTQINGPAVVLFGSDGDTAAFTAPESEGEVAFLLTVTTDQGLTDTSEVVVSVDAQGPPAPPMTSVALIDEAFSAGDITLDEALLNKVYAIFADDRLADKFAGAEMGIKSGSVILDEVVENFDSLSAETQTLIYPFLVPAYVEGSWYQLRAQNGAPKTGVTSMRRSPASFGKVAPGWASVKKGKVKVWYEEGYDIPQPGGVNTPTKTIAEAVLKAADGKIWSMLRGLMGKEPPSDLNFPLPSPVAGQGFNPGDLDQDGALDIVLCFSLGVDGNAHCYGKKPSPSFISIDVEKGPIGDEKTPGLIQTAAHEMMHVWQNSYKIEKASSTYFWLKEANAKWAEDFVYPNANSENGGAQPFMDHMADSLDSKAPPNREYGVYTAFSFWTNSYGMGGPDIIRQIWENCEDDSSLDAVDEANPISMAALMPHHMASFFERYWGDYMVAAWNRGNDGYFRRKDKLKEMPKARATKIVSVQGTGDRSYFLDALDPSKSLELPYLSTRYYHFIFPTDDLSSVSFYDGLRSKLEVKDLITTDYGRADGYVPTALEYPSPYIDPAEGAVWKVLLKIGGKWKEWENPLKVANYPIATFCRDYSKDRIEEMAIAIGNGSATIDNKVSPPNGGLAPVLMVSNIGCWGWEGDITVQYNHPEGGPNETTTTHVVFGNPADVLPQPPPIRPYGIFLVKDATTTTTVSGSSNWSNDNGDTWSCSYSGSGSFTWQEEGLEHELKMEPFALGGSLRRKAWFSAGSPPGAVGYVESCVYTWSELVRDDQGNLHRITHSESSTVDSELSPAVWPSSMEQGNTVQISGDGKNISGGFTEGDTTYSWSFTALRQ